MKIGVDYGSDTYTKEQLFERFITKKKSINLSPQSIVGYTLGWTMFLKFETHLKRYIPLHEINADLLCQYRLFLMEHTKANEVTRATYVKNLRTILRGFMEDGYLPTFQVILPKYSTPIQKTYSLDELARIMK